MNETLQSSQTSAEQQGRTLSPGEKLVPGTPQQEPQEPPEKIRGWLLFFLIIVLAGGLFTSFSHTRTIVQTDYELLVSDPKVGYVLMALDVSFALFLFCLATYTVWSFVERKPNAVFLGKMYVVYLVVINILSFLLNIDSLNTLHYGGAQLLRSLLWGVLWFTYLSVSKRVKRLFPVALRKVFRRDWYMLVAIVMVPLVLWSVAFAEIEHGDGGQEEVGLICFDPSSLPYGQYSDGYFAFTKPEGWACSEEYSESLEDSYFRLSLGDVCAAEISCYLVTDFNSEAFSQTVSGYWDNSEENLSIEVLGNTVETDALKRVYHYKARCGYENNPVQIWHFVVVQDLLSDKLCVIDFDQVYDSTVEGDYYVNQLIESVRFR